MHNFLEKLKIFKEILRPHKKGAVVLFVLILSSAFVEGLSLAFIMPLLDSIVSNQSTGFWSNIILARIKPLIPADFTLLALSLSFLILVILKNLLTLSKTAYSAYFTQGLKKNWMLKIKEKYLYASYAFVINHKQGYLLNNIIKEPTHAGGSLHRAVDFIATIVLAGVLYVVLFLASWKATIVITVVGIFSLFIINKFSTKYSSMFKKERIVLDQELSSQVAENISAIRQIKAFGIEGPLFKKFKDKLNRLIKIWIKFSVVKAVPKSMADVTVAAVVVGAVVFFQYVLHYDIKQSIPIIGMFLVVSQRLIGYLAVIVTNKIVMSAFIPSLFLVHKLTSGEQGKGKYSEGAAINGLQGDIIVKDVSFSYSSKVPIFSNLNLTIPLGKITAIVGLSGSGKSTLADLILGLYFPTSGQILINGRDIREINMHSWRNVLGFVSQDTFVFNTTIEENISMGCYASGVSKEDIIRSAKIAGAHNFIIHLSQGYKTVVGDRGLKLSGGQRQRIAIARALIRDPDFLIFDEATSALDSETEKSVQKSIEDLCKDRRKTILIIAHRLSTIENADIVYDLGKLCANELGALKSDG